MSGASRKRSGRGGDGDGAAKKGKLNLDFSCSCGNEEFVNGYLDFNLRGHTIQMLVCLDCQEAGQVPSCKYRPLFSSVN